MIDFGKTVIRFRGFGERDETRIRVARNATAMEANKPGFLVKVIKAPGSKIKQSIFSTFKL
jgi:hypothetical protein